MHYPITTEENTESLKYTEGNTLIQAVKWEDQYHWCGKYEDVASSQSLQPVLDLFKSMVCI